MEALAFFEQIYGDICGPIQYVCIPFKYYMVLIYTSTISSRVWLLSTHNMAFARFLAQIISLKELFPYFAINKIHLDNASEFTSQAFNSYCLSTG